LDQARGRSVKKQDADLLLAAAIEVRARAYAPFSRYRVGAAILTKNGSVFTGCNVENSTYGATICAERSAVAQMIAAGARDPIGCVVVTGGATPGSPCGICRQVLAEFAFDLDIVLVGLSGAGEKKRVRRATTLKKLLPDAFRLPV
jgi:cytidine deaminase